MSQTHGASVSLSAGDADAMSPSGTASLTVGGALSTTGSGGNGNIDLASTGTGGITVTGDLAAGTGQIDFASPVDASFQSAANSRSVGA